MNGAVDVDLVVIEVHAIITLGESKGGDTGRQNALNIIPCPEGIGIGEHDIGNLSLTFNPCGDEPVFFILDEHFHGGMFGVIAYGILETP